MIIYYLLQLLIGIGDAITSVFGSVTALPFGTDEPISQFWAWYLYIQEQMWPLEHVFTVIIIYIGWRISVKIYQIIFGSRAIID